MVGLQTLNLAIGVRVPASQPIFSPAKIIKKTKLMTRDLIDGVNHALQLV